MPDSSDNYSAFPIEYLLDNRFWRQCLRINMIVNLCLHERIKDGLPYCDNDNDEVLKLYFDKYPFAFCNIKKTVGGSNIKNKTLIDSSRTYIGYLREEVELLNPDVIYCCGDLKNTTKVVLDEVYGVPFTKVYTFSNGKGLWKHPDKDLLVIEGTHPSYQPKKSFDIYSSGLLECFSRKDNAHDGTIAEKSTGIYHDQAK